MRFFLAFLHTFSVSGVFPDALCVGVRFIVCLFSALLGIQASVVSVVGEDVAIGFDSCQFEML